MHYYVMDSAGRFYIKDIGFKTYIHHSATRFNFEDARRLAARHKGSTVEKI